MDRLWIFVAALLASLSLLAFANQFILAGVGALWLSCLPAVCAVLALERGAGAGAPL